MHMQKQTLAVSQKTGEFAAVRSDILRIQDNWNTFYEEFSQLDSPYTEEFKQHNQDFLQAIDKILKAIETPTLTLATTGTTSSGKSTLVNLLCGADIMPRMAGEMSAGIVTIKHASDGKRLLKIENTASATWECGEWKGLSDYDIRDRLTKTMDAFNKAKQEHELPSPIIELTYPIACFFSHAGMLDLSNLPSHTQFQIMDLPGKRNQDDKINSTVIQNCRRALSIVTYNMEETDETRRQSLVEEVLEQIKLMGGSPARMLFALNRIDVFRKDHDWERREQETAEQTIKEIKQILHDRLPEHRNALMHLSYSKLSSLPALLAWQVKTNQNDNRAAIADQLDDHFSFMLSDELKDELPRSTKRWEETNFQNVRDAIWESSYAKDFFPVLEKHIHENFAKLIVAPLLVEFEGVVLHIIGQADRTCMVEVESSDKALEEVKEKLETDYTIITGKLSDYHDDLMLLPTFIKQSSGILENLDNIEIFPETFGSSKIYNDENIKSSILPAFSRSSLEPITYLTGISEGVTQSLKAGNINFRGTKADELSNEHGYRLKSICRNLISSGYDTDIASHGANIKAVSDNEKSELNKALDVIHSFSSDLSTLMQEVYEKKVERESKRVQELIEEIVKTFITHVNEFIKSLNLMTELKFNIALLGTIGLDIPSIEFGIEFDQEIKAERNPWLLWLSKRDVSYTDIPSADELHNMIVGHLQSIKKQATKPLQEAISKYYEEVDKKIRDYIESIMDDLGAKFEATYAKHEGQHQQQEKNWEDLRGIAKNILSDMNQLSTQKV